MYTLKFSTGKKAVLTNEEFEELQRMILESQKSQSENSLYIEKPIWKSPPNFPAK